MPFRRLLVVTLPVCFIWLFVACVVLCSEHQARTQEPHIAGLAAETECSDESGCCPITSTPASLLPERSSSIKQVDDDQQGLSILVTQVVSDVPDFYGHAHERSPAFSPPIQRLYSLRI